MLESNVIKALELSEDWDGKAYKFDDRLVTFSARGNCTDSNYNYIPVNILLMTWKDKIGEEVNFDGARRVISEVNVQGDYVFIQTVKIQ
jgi:hypothetical protein